MSCAGVWWESRNATYKIAEEFHTRLTCLSCGVVGAPGLSPVGMSEKEIVLGGRSKEVI